MLSVSDGWVYFVRYPIGRRTTLLSFPAGMQTQLYDMTPQGQAIWAVGPARPKGPWTIWRWSGGTPAQITAFPPPRYGVGAIVW